MKIWLDDCRPAPEEWVLCRWPEEVIELLKTEEVDEISLGHDLADPLVVGQGYCSSLKERTGYDVLTWIEEQVVCNNFEPPKIHIHSANSAAQKRMLAAVDKIQELWRR